MSVYWETVLVGGRRQASKATKEAKGAHGRGCNVIWALVGTRWTMDLGEIHAGANTPTEHPSPRPLHPTTLS